VATYKDLDIDSVARIGLLFLDGDSLEEVLLDRYGHPDYDFDKFNNCKRIIMKIERMNPTLGLTAILWQKRPDNDRIVVPVVTGNALPLTGFRSTESSPAMEAAFTGRIASAKRQEGGTSYYYPVKNSDAEIVGILELLSGDRPNVDI
jgi:hypothetical protein